MITYIYVYHVSQPSIIIIVFNDNQLKKSEKSPMFNSPLAGGGCGGDSGGSLWDVVGPLLAMQ